ncbi:hypothetical protein SAMN04488115_10828 [Bosea lathyri]|uniref:Uncharacterized protein n=1 Tax=Bosea lathyri TaxID=1036778 RepID=A0A1H6BSM8_9HYPH|nr:hypothetical protein SAMN04488115_10828 [Bosea lathyri]
MAPSKSAVGRLQVRVSRGTSHHVSKHLDLTGGVNEPLFLEKTLTETIYVDPIVKILRR